MKVELEDDFYKLWREASGPEGSNDAEHDLLSEVADCFVAQATAEGREDLIVKDEKDEW
jgi:hypothetical protein